MIKCLQGLQLFFFAIIKSLVIYASMEIFINFL